MTRRRILQAGLVLAAAGVLPCFPVDPGRKQLIEFGWDEPGTAFLREHIAELQRTTTESLGAIQSAMDQSASERAKLAADLRQRVAQLDELEARRAQIAAAL